MRIGEETVRYVAHLSRIDLSEEEVKEFSFQLARILDYIEQLKELDISGVEPTSHAIEIEAPLRDDELKESLPQEDSLLNAPERKGPFFKVPAIMQT